MTINTDNAPSITRAASKQTYYTIRFLADRDRVADAYRAYAYFRWVDDMLDSETGSRAERCIFIEQQMSILDRGYQGRTIRTATPQEEMLAALIQGDIVKNSGLQMYIRNMMAVMAFDVERRGRLISHDELNEYTRLLASAVTEAMHYFVGHGCHSPRDETRYLAVTAAHITHMLRDTYDDVHAGYFNIPREVLEANRILPQDVSSDAYRAWVRSRVKLARTYFKAGRDYLRQVKNARCRLAGFAYMARFEWLLDTIGREGYRLRLRYHERKSFGTGLRMSLDTLSAVLHSREAGFSPQTFPAQKHF